MIVVLADRYWREPVYECRYCGLPLRECAACGIDCRCVDGALCERHVDDDDKVSPEELEWLEETGDPWRPVFGIASGMPITILDVMDPPATADELPYGELDDQLRPVPPVRLGVQPLQVSQSPGERTRPATVGPRR